MSDNISIIGGADGPTSVFVAGKLGMNWLNTFGLVLVILLLIPNIIYAVRVKNQKNKCTNKFRSRVQTMQNRICRIILSYGNISNHFFFSPVPLKYLLLLPPQ